MTLKRACSLLTVKSFSEDERVITGIASTPSPDRDGDILEPEGAEFGSAIPFLWQHDHSRPVGQCTVRRVSEGLEITATLVKPEPGMPSQLAARLDEAWAAIKTGLVRGLSVGFRPHEYTFLDGGGLHFLRWELMEVSAVTVPANAECTIQTIKSYDRPFSAASGNRKPVVEIASSAGSSAQSTTVFHEGKTVMNIGEQIKSFENKRAALAASLEEIMSKAAEEGRTLDVEEEEHYDNTAAEIRQVDAHLKRLRELEAGKAATAQPVKQAGNGDVVTVTSAPVIRVEQKLDKGIGFARFAKSLAAAKGVRSEALEVARRQYPDDSRLHHVLKSAVGAGTTTDPQWAGSLSEYQEYAQDFIEYLRPQTIIGRFGQGGIPALRQVPFNIRVHAQVSGGAAGWVGEGKAKPLTKFDFESITFSHAKVSAIAVLTEELIRFSSPAADALVRNALAEAVVARLDTDFVDPKKAAVVDVSPASITHDVKGTASTGNPDADAEAAFGQFVAANLQPTGAVWLMSSTNALALSMRKNALGQKEYPDMTLLGGTFQGLPVIVSQYVGDQLILVNAPDIYLADDGGVAVDMSREASLEMQSEPTGDSTTPSPVDAQTVEQLKMTAEIVCSVFRVPAYKIGVGQPPSSDNVEAMEQQYYSQCLQTLIESIELLLDEALETGENESTEFDVTTLLRMDSERRMKTLGEAVKNTLLTPNEARKRENLPPLAGGDALYLQQQNYSLEALSRRDAREDPFASSGKTVSAQPPDGASAGKKAISETERDAVKAMFRGTLKK